MFFNFRKMRSINFILHPARIKPAIVNLAKWKMRSVNLFAKSADLHLAGNVLWNFAKATRRFTYEKSLFCIGCDGVLTRTEEYECGGKYKDILQ